jgi:carbon storage regulator CsrA
LLLAVIALVAQNEPPSLTDTFRIHPLTRRFILMNVISRRENESVVIGAEVVITVLEVANDHVRLAIKSPTEGYREETLFVPVSDEHQKTLELLAATH